MKSARVCGCSPNTADARFCPSPGLFRIILCAITSVPHFLVTVNIFYKKLVNPYLTSQDSCDNINPSTRILLNQTPHPRGASQFRTSRNRPEGGGCLRGEPFRVPPAGFRSTRPQAAAVFQASGLEYGSPTKTKNTPKRAFCFGGGGWIRTTEVSDNRFTVCPI